MSATVNVRPEHIKIGVCKVIFDGQDLGSTKGGVSVTVETTTHEVKVDQTGESIIKELVTGRNITATVPLAETTIENLVKIMPGARLISGSDGKKRVDVPTGVGQDLLNHAKKLVLHPIEKADNDKSDDLIIYKAATGGGLDFSYEFDNERVFECEFKGYPDPSNGNTVFSLGDEDATE